MGGNHAPGASLTFAGVSVSFTIANRQREKEGR